MGSDTQVVVADTDGRIVLFDRLSEVASGYRADEVLGKLLWECLIMPAHLEVAQRAFFYAVGEAAPAADEIAWRLRDGSGRLARTVFTPLRGTDGAAQRIVITINETELAQSFRAELGDALDRYQAILDTTVDGIITITDRGRIESFNRAAERLFGYRASEVVGQNVAMLMPSPHREQHDVYLETYLHTRRKKIIGVGREVEGLRKDGTVFPMELSVGETLLASGRIFTGIVRDISDRRDAENEARRRLGEMAQLMRLRSMGDLAAGLAHEVNQPLTAIISHAQACLRMIQAGRADIDLLGESMQQIARQGERAAEVIKRLRKFVEKGEVDKQAFDIVQCIAEVRDLLSHELRDARVTVELEAEQDIPPVLIDRVQIEQVIFNLVRNAIDAMRSIDEEARWLRIAVLQTGMPGGVEVRVCDNGPGFSERDVDRVFEPFFTTKHDGLGQGLSICRRIIEAHHGRIWVQPGVRSGAMLCFWLPLHMQRQ